MIQIFQLLLSLSILVILHEFGHYLAARFFGCRVEKFYLFMDWGIGSWSGAIFKKQVGDTEFGVGWAPLGGYVKISGFIDESMDSDGAESEPREWELRSKPAWQRLIVMLGGVVVNIILAWFIYSMILLCWGQNYIPMENLVDGFSFNEGGEKLGFVDGDKIMAIDNVPVLEYDPMFILSSVLFEGAENVMVLRGLNTVSINLNPDSVNSVISNLQNYKGNLIDANYRWIVSGVSTNSPLKEAGLEAGDRIIQVGNLKTEFVNLESREYVRSFSGETMVLIVKKASGEIKELSCIVPKDGVLGVYYIESYSDSKSFSLIESVPAGLKKTQNMIKMYWGQVKTIFNPKTGGYKHVGGLISIGKLFSSSWDWFSFWSMTALLSIILAIMNLLPIPALDGGHAVIAIIEMVSGKKLPLSILMPLQIVGMVLLFILLIYANGMDIVRLFN